jgi:DNA-binding response OmpR family regulator
MLRRVRLIREEVNHADGEEGKPKPKIMEFGNLKIDMTRREITVGGEVVAFKPKEYELLTFLAQHQGQVLSREFILERVWGWDFIGDSRTVDVHVRWLREKIEPDPANPQRIITVRGAGYRFEG